MLGFQTTLGKAIIPKTTIVRIAEIHYQRHLCRGFVLGIPKAPNQACVLFELRGDGRPLEDPIDDAVAFELVRKLRQMEQGEGWDKLNLPGDTHNLYSL